MLGANSEGELGNGATANEAIPQEVTDLGEMVELVAGGHHNCARPNDVTVLCWGNNNRGQIGDGTNINRSVPVFVLGL